MNPNLLPSANIIHNPDKDIINLFQHITTIKNKKCLCIGYSEQELRDYVIKYCPENIVILTNFEDHKDANISTHKVIIGDISKKTQFNDNEFDMVLTFSLLGNIQNLGGCFSEVKKILKPNGYFYAFFGPVWSSAYGHHIYATPGDPLLEFTMWQMPSHIHLLCSEDEIIEYYLSKNYTKEKCKTVLHWFYGTSLINRIMFDKYLQLFATYFSVVTSELMYNDIKQEILYQLRKKFPDNIDFSTYGGKFLL